MSNWVTGDPRAGSQTVRRITSEQNANNLWPAVGQQMTAEEGKRWRALYSAPPIPPPIHQPIPLLATIHSRWLIDKGKWEHSVVRITQLWQVLRHAHFLSTTATITVPRGEDQAKLGWSRFVTADCKNACQSKKVIVCYVVAAAVITFWANANEEYVFLAASQEAI